MTTKRSRNYVFTVNNYTTKMLKDFHKVAKSLEKHNYICYGLEEGEKKTKHIQAYIQLENAMTYSALQKYFSLMKKGKLDKFHVERAKGSLKQNQKYTSKEGQWFEYGDPKSQGSRTDLDDLREQLRNDPRSARSIMKNDDLNYQQIRYVETVTKYLFEHREPDDPPVVLWIWGNSGIGKTKKVYDEFDHKEIYSVTDYNWLGQDYFQQQVYLFDDFRADDIPFHTLLKICDRYPYTLPVKGSHIPLKSKYIIITSNQSVLETFTFLPPNEDVEQIVRRVQEFHFSEIKDTPLKNLASKKSS